MLKLNSEEVQGLLLKLKKNYQLVDQLNMNTYLVSKLNNLYILKILDRNSGKITNFNKLKQLNHFGIPKFLEDIETNKFILTISEYIPGQTLRHLIDHNSLISEEQSLIWIKQLAEILDYLIGNDFLHRDIKPGNIIIDNKNNLNLIDFGLVRRKDERDSIDFNVIGTRKYTAPERYLREPANCQTEIYSYGCTCFNLLTKLSPNEVKPRNYKSYWQMLLNLKKINNKKIRKIVKNCINYYPEKRYQNFKHILNDLNRI